MIKRIKFKRERSSNDWFSVTGCGYLCRGAMDDFFVLGSALSMTVAISDKKVAGAYKVVFYKEDGDINILVKSDKVYQEYLTYTMRQELRDSGIIGKDNDTYYCWVELDNQ